MTPPATSDGRVAAEKLLELAEACEKASEPDRDLFERAFVACFGKASEEMRPDVAAAWIDRWRPFSTFIDVGAWLDAAMTLVPEGWRIGDLSQHDHLSLRKKGEWTSWLYPDGRLEPATSARPRCRFAATPALALTAAALRARADGVRHDG